MSISPKNEASQNNTAKRRDYISWDEYFMGIAMLSAMRSKDPNSQVGACIVRDNKILSLGYNGMPIGCDDDIMPWGREGNELETKYMYVCHSELNAILNAGKDLHGSTMYVTLFPCNECAKAIIQSGIKRIVYLDDKYRDANNNVAARHMFKIAGVVIITAGLMTATKNKEYNNENPSYCAWRMRHLRGRNGTASRLYHLEYRR